MKVIIAGSRTITDYITIRIAIQEALYDWGVGYEEVNEVISGNAFGVDKLGVEWAVKNNKKFRLFPALWDVHGKFAGYIRNVEMAEYADYLIAIWDGKSKGTQHMITIASKKGLKIYVHKI